MGKLYSSIRLGWKVFADKFWSVKTATLFLLLGFVQHIFLSPIKEFSESVNYPVAPVAFPFLISDIYFLILFMSAVIYFFSDVPFMKERTMYQVIRVGRVRWSVGQIISIILSSYIFVIVAILENVLILLPDITVNEGWGKVLYTLSMTSAASDYRIPFSVSYDIISKFEPLKAMVVTILMCGLVIAFIGLLMFALSLYISRLCANVIAMLLTILPIVSVNVGRSASWLMYCSPVSWMRISELNTGSEVGNLMPPISLCIGILLIGCMVLSGAIVWKIKTVDFKLVKED